jgi:VanZ family protein
VKSSYCTGRVRTWKQWLPVVVWAGLILSAANDAFSADTTGGLLQQIFGEIPHVLHVALRKGAHLVVYAILGALACRADRRWAVAMAVALAVACADETLQSRAMSRTGTPWDVALDMAGATIGVALFERSSGLRRR